MIASLSALSSSACIFACSPARLLCAWGRRRALETRVPLSIPGARQRQRTIVKTSEGRRVLGLAMIAAVFLAGCGSSGDAKRQAAVCRNVHENGRLLDALVTGQPPDMVKNPTPATVVTRRLGKPDRSIPARAGFSWWVYGNTAYAIVPLGDGVPFVGGKTCDWGYTARKLGINR